MASNMYDEKKQIIEEKRKRLIDEAILKHEDIVKKSNKDRRTFWDGAALVFFPFFFPVFRWVALVVILGICAGTGIIGTIVVVVLLLGSAIGLGVYMSFNSNNKADIAIRNSGTIKRDTINKIEKNYRDELSRLNSWYSNYEQNVKKLADQYRSGTEAPKLAQRMEGQFIHLIDNARRDPRIKVIDVDYDYTVHQDRITYGSQLNYAFQEIDFEQERLNPLQSELQCEALAQAIARMIITNFKRKYPSDNVSIKHNDAMVFMHYTGINPNYIPKRNI